MPTMIEQQPAMTAEPPPLAPERATTVAVRPGVVEQVRSRLPLMLADLEQLVRCESPTDDLASVAASAELVARMGSTYLGREPESIVIEGRTHLRWRLPGSGPRILLIGHHDTVWPVGSLQTHPWSVEPGSSGPIVRGPGCFDMKCGIVQLFHAVDLMAVAPALTVLITGDEEIGSPTSRELIEAEARAADVAFVLEPAGDGGAFKTERKGISLYEVSVQGLAAHAGLEPERGINATVELAAQVLHIAALGRSELGTTVTPTTMTAGSTGNTVPAAGRLAVDVRAVTRTELERVDVALRGLSPHLEGAVVSISGGINRPPLEREKSGGLYDLAVELSTAAGQDRPAECAVGGGSDGNFTAGVGTPTLDGLGAVGGGAHADHEHLLVDHIPPRTALLVALIEHLHGLPTGGAVG